MALGTFAELKASIADWLDRDDMTARIPDFITLAEERINAEMEIRTVETDQSLTATPSSRTITLPASFREPVALWFVINGERVDKAYQQAATFDASAIAGEPLVWCVDGGDIAFDRPCDQAYSVILRQRGGVALSDSATTNFVLSKYPSLYLWGALNEAAIFLRDPELRATAEGRFGTALETARTKESRAAALQPLRTEIGAGVMNGRRGFNIFRG